MVRGAASAKLVDLADRPSSRGRKIFADADPAYFAFKVPEPEVKATKKEIKRPAPTNADIERLAIALELEKLMEGHMP